MAWLVPAIHAFFSLYAVSGEDVGGRNEGAGPGAPGDDVYGALSDG